jgi:uncharacterized membrane protein
VEQVLSEEWLRGAVGLLVRLVEFAGALVIFAGAVLGLVRLCIAILGHRSPTSFSAVRLGLGRFLALGLEFQLASDLLRTAVAPSFDQIGKLAAIAAIRTALNFFLARELQEERQHAQGAPEPSARPSAR